MAIARRLNDHANLYPQVACRKSAGKLLPAFRPVRPPTATPGDVEPVKRGLSTPIFYLISGSNLVPLALRDAPKSTTGSAHFNCSR